MHDFNYQRAASLEDALAKHRDSDDARFLAGGMTLIAVLKLRLDRPSDVIDLGFVEDLRGIHSADGMVRIGAMTTHAAVARSAAVQSAIPALARLAGAIGDPLIRNRGTLGGSLANNDPSADYPAGVLALNATIETDRRSIAADDYFLGMFNTALEEGELIRRVSFPVPQRAAYARFANPASRYPLAGVFVADAAGGPRVAVTGAGPGVFRISEMENRLAERFAEDAVSDVQVPADDLLSDIHATPEYRAQLIAVMARRAVAEALAEG